jgi:hypothetical protein
MQQSGDECADWGIGWQNDLSHHMHITSVQTTLDFEQLGSFEHSDFQQQGSEYCWATESLDTVG